MRQKKNPLVACGEHYHPIKENEHGVVKLPLCFINQMFKRQDGPEYVPVLHTCQGIAFYCERTYTLDQFPGARKVNGQVPKENELLICGTCNAKISTGSLSISIPATI